MGALGELGARSTRRRTAAPSMPRAPRSALSALPGLRSLIGHSVAALPPAAAIGDGGSGAANGVKGAGPARPGGGKCGAGADLAREGRGGSGADPGGTRGGLGGRRGQRWGAARWGPGLEGQGVAGTRGAGGLSHLTAVFSSSRCPRHGQQQPAEPAHHQLPPHEERPTPRCPLGQERPRRSCSAPLAAFQGLGLLRPGHPGHTLRPGHSAAPDPQSAAPEPPKTPG